MQINVRFLIVVLFLISCSLMLSAQEVIRSVAYEQQSSQWYEQQAALWKKQIAKDPKNEWAWENYYRAWHNLNIVDRNAPEAIKQKPAEILAAMKKAIPDSFTFNLLTFYNSGNNSDYRSYIEKAIALRPDDARYFNTYAGYLMTIGDEARMEKLFAKWYQSGAYYPSLLNYAYNLLAGLPEKAIVIDNGDNPVFSEYMIRYGKGLFNNKTIVCWSMYLYCPEYANMIKRQTGIDPFAAIDSPVNKGKYKTQDEYEKAALDHLISQAQVPLYFSLTMPSVFDELKDSLYTEGLAMRYATRPYDNIALMNRNFTETYLLDYLRMSFSPFAEAPLVRRMDLNYVMAFKPLLDFFRTSGDYTRTYQLDKLLKGIVQRSSEFLTPEKSAQYLNWLDENAHENVPAQ